MKVLLGLLIIIGLSTYTQATITPLYQSMWYIQMDENSSPIRHQFGMKNFYFTAERTLFTNKHVYQRTDYFRTRVDRQSTDSVITYIPADLNDFDKQFYMYFPTIKFEDPRGGYYVIEDLYNCYDDDNQNINTFCESKFWITYFRNYKSARLNFEQRLVDVPADTTPYIVFGGPEGFIDSPKMDYFVQKYLHAWCPYRFGIYNGDALNQSTIDDRQRVYLRDDSLLTAITDTDDVYLPFLKNEDIDPAALPTCDFHDDVNGKFTFFPTEFQTNCALGVDNDPTPDTGEIPRKAKHYLGCWNQFSSDDVKYYINPTKCKIGNRIFLKTESLYMLNPSITFTFSCSLTGGAPNSFTLTKTYRELMNGSQNTVTTTNPVETCEFPATSLSDCTAKVVSCTGSTDHKYFNYSYVVTNANSYPDGAPTGVVSYSFTLTTALSLYKFTTASNPALV